MAMNRWPVSAVWFAFVPYVALSVVHVAALAVGSDIAGPTKLALMPLLALPVLVAWPWVRPRSVALFLLAALLLSWLGDGAGTFFPGGPELPLMLLFFGLAHVTYMLLFGLRLRERRIPWWALVYVVWYVALLALLRPHLGELLIPVAIYGLVLAGTAVLASACTPVVAAGGAFFLISDTILAFRIFLPDVMPDWTSPAVMATYTLGQGLIVAGALMAVNARRTLEPQGSGGPHIVQNATA